MTAPVVAWARAIFDALSKAHGAIPSGELLRLWQAMRSRGVKRWADARGPLDAAWLTLRRLGWDWTEPWAMTTDEGVRIPFRLVGPKMLKRHLCTSSRRQLEAQVGRRLREQGWTGMSDHSGQCSAAAVQRVMAEKATTEDGRHWVRAVATGAFWPAQRLAEAGYAVDARCPLCKDAPDTAFHRLWECPCTRDLRQEKEVAKVAERALEAGPNHITFSTGLLENAPAHWLAPADADP